ncbi:MAG: hypothetical protein KC731_20850 [Myxococcales bacterium]|nr:hypothetical protein [Myxococcales bacterium]
MRSLSLATILTLLVAGSACSSEKGEDLELIDGGATIQVGSSWKACDDVSDCAEVGTSCDDCCAMEAISATRVEEFRTAAADLCSGYQGGVCDCAPLETDMVCESGLCQLVPVE